MLLGGNSDVVKNSPEKTNMTGSIVIVHFSILKI